MICPCGNEFEVAQWQINSGRGKYCSRANISREYKRELDDFEAMCYQCHRDYDKGHWGAVNKIFRNGVRS